MGRAGLQKRIENNFTKGHPDIEKKRLATKWFDKFHEVSDLSVRHRSGKVTILYKADLYHCSYIRIRLLAHVV